MSLLLREAEIRSAEAEEPVQTVYIGGGTPTSLDLPILNRFLDYLSEIRQKYLFPKVITSNECFCYATVR